MAEWLKLAIEGGSFGVSLFLVNYLFRKFIRKEVIEPIKELKAENDEIKKNFTVFTNRITEFIFKMLKSHGDLMDSVNQDVNKMNNLFTEATRHTSQSRMESYEALKKVNVLEQTTEKLLKISTMVHDKNKKIESEVKQITKDLIMVKTKTGIKSDD